MKLLKEITGIAGGFRYPEHVYALNDAGKLVAFKHETSDEYRYFEKPLAFDKRGRKFKEIKDASILR